MVEINMKVLNYWSSQEDGKGYYLIFKVNFEKVYDFMMFFELHNVEVRVLC